MPGGVKRVRFLVRGIVQGVGFRPFVSKTATRLGLFGTVANTTRGVVIEVEGSLEKIRAFEIALTGNPPKASKILSIDEEELAPLKDSSPFKILASREDPIASVVIPPDIATCAECAREILDPGDRRYDYPFTNCTDCGPRYSIIGGVPYDRALTAMAAFKLCADCEREYSHPAMRRFHAQPNACPKCGPKLSALRPDGREVAGEPLDIAAKALKEGKIVALLGLGGFHLAVDAQNEEAVALLRERKNRPAKPFAVMTKDISSARRLAHLSGDAVELMTSAAAPIYLTEARDKSPLAPSVAPGQSAVGLFLPYTPLNILLFERGDCPPALVMTSGNRSDEPIISTWEKARERLAGVVDLFIIHNRPILHPIDDSVVKGFELGSIPVRRARGYAPVPIPLPYGDADGPVLLGAGAELMNTYAILRGELAFVGPHVGDLKNPDTVESYTRGISNLEKLLKVEVEGVVCDMHPSYRSTIFAKELASKGVGLLEVQHHEAHAATVMAENSFDGEGVVLALDGTGLGHDGTIWGCEIFSGRPGSFKRVGSLATVPMPGGDRAAKEPWRMAAAHLRRVQGEKWIETPLPAFTSMERRDLELLEAIMARGLNSPLTSSAGRLFDAAAAITLGFTGEMKYSAHAPMLLEAYGRRAKAPRRYEVDGIALEDGFITIDAAGLLVEMEADILRGRAAAEVALGFHHWLGETLVEAAFQIAERNGQSDLFLTGGVFTNAILTLVVERAAKAKGLRVHRHKLLPPGDNSISYGQLAWAKMSGADFK